MCAHADPPSISLASTPWSIVITQGNTLQVAEGPITITLTVSSNPRPSSYVWLMDGEQVTTDSKGLTLALDSITFNPAMREHSGKYTLVATNSVGTGDFTFTLDVLCKSFFPL